MSIYPALANGCKLERNLLCIQGDMKYTIITRAQAKGKKRCYGLQVWGCLFLRYSERLHKGGDWADS